MLVEKVKRIFFSRFFVNIMYYINSTKLGTMLDITTPYCQDTPPALPQTRHAKDSDGQIPMPRPVGDDCRVTGKYTQVSKQVASIPKQKNFQNKNRLPNPSITKNKDGTSRQSQRNDKNAVHDTLQRDP